MFVIYVLLIFAHNNSIMSTLHSVGIAFTCSGKSKHHTYSTFDIYGEQNGVCKSPPQNETYSPSPPMNFTMTVAPNSFVDRYRSRVVIFSWKIPQHGDLPHYFLLKHNISGKESCSKMGFADIPDLIDNAIISCQYPIPNWQTDTTIIQSSLTSVPVSSSVQPAFAQITVNNTSPIYVSNSDCGKSVTVSFIPYGYHQYQISLVERHKRVEMFKTTAVLNEPRSKVTFTNVMAAQYSVKLQPADGCEGCKGNNTPLIFPETCFTSTRPSASSISFLPSTINNTRITPVARNLSSNNKTNVIVAAVVSITIVVALILFAVFMYRRFFKGNVVPMMKPQFDPDHIPSVSTNKKILLLSTQYSDRSVKILEEYLRHIGCEVWQSISCDEFYKVDPRAWLEKRLNDCDNVLIVNTQIACQKYIYRNKIPKSMSELDKMFCNAIDIMKSNHTHIENGKYIMVRFNTTYEDFVLSEQIPGEIYELPNQFVDVLHRIDPVTFISLNNLNSMEAVIARIHAEQNSNLLRSGVDSGFSSFNVDIDGLSCYSAQTSFIAPPPTDAVSEKMDSPLDFIRGHPGVDELSDLGSIRTDFVPVSDMAFSICDHLVEKRENASNISTFNKLPAFSDLSSETTSLKTDFRSVAGMSETRIGCNIHGEYDFDDFKILPSINWDSDSYLSQDELQTIIPPESENQFEGNSNEIRYCNFLNSLSYT